MARSHKAKKTMRVITAERRWDDVCDTCNNKLGNATGGGIAPVSCLFIVPRLIFLPESRIPLIVPELNVHLLVCEECKESYGEPIAVEDRGYFREQKILWNKPEFADVKRGIIKYCGFCTTEIEVDREDDLRGSVGAIYILPRLILKESGLRQIETRGSEIKLIICKECVATLYRPLGVEQAWRFEGDILRPELVRLKRKN